MVVTAKKRRRNAQSRRAKQDEDRRNTRIFNRVWQEWQPKLYPVKPEEQAAPALASATEVSQAKFLSSWFNNHNYSDATIYIHGVKLYAHKLVICGKCQYFANAFDKFKEGEQGFIEFNQGSAMAYFRVFQYLYTGDYLAEWEAQGLEDDLDLLKDPRVKCRLHCSKAN
ncbi:hypothetical protein HBI51_248640 [Parastagonospora nodorum]|nr:hypothetical protein HBI51_248640 [Parastagonospora nodorum]